MLISCSVSNFYEYTYRRDFHLQVHYDGWVRWSFGGVVTTSCDIDLSLYPFDHQHCPVVVESWQYEKAKVRLRLVPGTVLDTDNADPDPQWILEEADVSIEVLHLFTAVCMVQTVVCAPKVGQQYEHTFVNCKTSFICKKRLFVYMCLPLGSDKNCCSGILHHIYLLQNFCSIQFGT